MRADDRSRPPTWLARPDPETLAQALGQAAMRDPEHPAWADGRFLRWLASRARQRVNRSEDATALGEALLARSQARSLGVTRIDAPPVSDDATWHDRGVERGARRASLVDLGVAAGDGRELWDEPPQRWVALPDTIPDGEYLAFRIVGESMSPLMHTGDTVLVQRGARVERDTVVVARHPDDGYLCKRVARVRRTTIELASLEPGRPVVTIPRDARLILGTVLMVWRGHR